MDKKLLLIVLDVGIHFFYSDDAVSVKKVNCINGALKRSERFQIHFIVYGNKSSHLNYINCSLMQRKIFAWPRFIMMLL